MHFNLMSLHLGDVLMAMPAMREGDLVSVRDRHKVPDAPVLWTECGGASPRDLDRKHQTAAWLDMTGRSPVRHELMATEERTALLLAPDVTSERKQWGGWAELTQALPEAKMVGSSVNRLEWMRMLNSAHTVVCPDTGTAHMADALGVPKVIVLHGMGQKHFERYAPFWNKKYCIVRDTMEDITIDSVMEMVHG